MNEPLSYEPAGSRVVILSVVPMVIGAPPAPLVLPPPAVPPPLGPVQAVKASIETPASATA